MDSPVKVCHNCSIVKYVTEFGRSKTSADGLQTICKPCKNEQQMNWKRKRASSENQVLLLELENNMLKTKLEKMLKDFNALKQHTEILSLSNSHYLKENAMFLDLLTDTLLGPDDSEVSPENIMGPNKRSRI
jgi:superfamily II helicase